MKLLHRNGTVAYEGDLSLQELSISGFHLKNLDLSGMRIEGTFQNIIFDNTDLTKSDISGSIFIKCNLKDTDFTMCDAVNTQFIDCTMRENIFKYMRATNSIWDGSNLRESKFFNAILDGASFKNCDLRNCNFRNANLSCADLGTAKINGITTRMAVLCGNNLPAFYAEPVTSFYFYGDEPINSYKLTNSKSQGIYYSSVEYKVGKEVSAGEISKRTNPGLFVGSLQWCIREWISLGSDPNFRLFRVQCKSSDILLHYGKLHDIHYELDTDSGFSVSKLRVVDELDLNQFRKHLKLD
jgi:hypothetical protein